MDNMSIRLILEVHFSNGTLVQYLKEMDILQFLLIQQEDLPDHLKHYVETEDDNRTISGIADKFKPGQNEFGF